MINHVLTLLYPSVCPLCRIKSEKTGLCQGCFDSIERMPPSANKARYQNIDIYYQKLYSVGLYKGILKEAIHLLKYKGKLSLVKDLSGLLIEFANINLDITQIDLIVPVPLHNTKLREREFNQATVLAIPIAKKFGIRLSQGNLERVRATQPQTGLKKHERLQNLKDVFKVKNPSMINEKRVLLVDDVFTTGATVNECSKVLFSSGASDVSVLTLARGDQ